LKRKNRSASITTGSLDCRRMDIFLEHKHRSKRLLDWFAGDQSRDLKREAEHVERI
jgi:hypothetical protein